MEMLSIENIIAVKSASSQAAHIPNLPLLFSTPNDRVAPCSIFDTHGRTLLSCVELTEDRTMTELTKSHTIE